MKIILQVFQIITMPLALAYIGWQVTSSLESAKLNQQYVQIASDILSQSIRKNEEVPPIRRWAASVLKKFTPVEIGENEYADLVSGKARTSSDFPYVEATAFVKPKTAKVGEVVSFIADASGGNGFYSFYWEGSDGLKSFYPVIDKRFTTPGVKKATVEITSYNQTIKREVSIEITP